MANLLPRRYYRHAAFAALAALALSAAVVASAAAAGRSLNPRAPQARRAAIHAAQEGLVETQYAAQGASLGLRVASSNCASSTTATTSGATHYEQVHRVCVAATDRFRSRSGWPRSGRQCGHCALRCDGSGQRSKRVLIDG
jgi:hypothetical protein